MKLVPRYGTITINFTFTYSEKKDNKTMLTMIRDCMRTVKERRKFEKNKKMTYRGWLSLQQEIRKELK